MFHRLTSLFNQRKDTPAADNEFVLPNKMKVRVAMDGDNPMVTATLRMNVGSHDDLPGVEGTAHMLEHFLARYVRSDATMQDIRKRGGVLDAFTHTDKTEFTITLPRSSENEKFIYQTLAQKVFNPQWDQEFFEEEKAVIINELYDRYDSASEAERQFVESSYGYKTGFGIGTIKTIQNITLRDLKAFHDYYYNARNATLSASGVSSLKSAETEARQAFCDVREGQGNILAKPHSYMPYEASNGYVYAHQHQNELNIFVPVNAPDTFAKTTMTALGTYLEDQITYKLRGDKNRITYSPRVSEDNCGPYHYLRITARTGPYNVPNALQRIGQVLADTAAGNIDDEAWEYARKTMDNKCANIFHEIKKGLIGNEQRQQYQGLQNSFKENFANLSKQDISAMMRESLRQSVSFYETGKSPTPNARDILERAIGPATAPAARHTLTL